MIDDDTPVSEDGRERARQCFQGEITGWLDNVAAALTAAVAEGRRAAIEDAAWAAHCWIVNQALTRKIQDMPPSDISCGVGDAIRALAAEVT